MCDTGGCGTSKRSGHGHRGPDAVSLPSPPSLAAWKVSSRFTQCKSDLSYEWLLLLLAKAAVDNTVGKSWLGSKQPELQRGNLNSEFIKLTAPGHSELPRATQSRNSPPAPAESPAPACQQLLTLSPNRGAFLSFFSWYFVVWMLIPLTKLSPMLFPFSFCLISFSQWKKEKKRVREKKKKENTSQPSLAAPGFALIPPLSFMLPTGISIWL